MQKTETKPSDPIAAGVYTGSMSDNGRIIANVRTNITTTVINGNPYISSVGFAATSYQVVLSGRCNEKYTGCYLTGTSNGYEYVSQSARSDGKILNVSGRYRVSGVVGSTTNPARYADFSFTGSR